MASSDDAGTVLAPAPPAITVSTTFNDPRADVVIQTSDGVQFKLRRHVLTTGSGFFNGLFDIPGDAAGSNVEEIPVIEVAEVSADWTLFLPFLCRGHPTELLDFAQIKTLLKMADK